MATSSNLGCGPSTVKYLVFIFNFLFFISGSVLMIVGGIAQGFFSSNMIFFHGRYETPAMGIVILGAVILVISFFGCCGAKRENVFMSRVFAGSMVSVSSSEFAVAITVAVSRPNIEESVKKNMNESMQHYGDPKDSVTISWDDLQRKHHCCGTVNYTDWRTTAYGSNSSVEGVPDSCCKAPVIEGCGHDIWEEATPPSQIYMTPCYKAITDSARANTGAIIGGIIGLALSQMVGVWMSCCLIRAVKERYEIS